MRVQTYSNTRYKQDQTEDNYWLVKSLNELAAPGMPRSMKVIRLIGSFDMRSQYAEPIQPADGQVVYGFGGSFVWSDDPEFPASHPIPLHDRVIRTESY